MKRILMNKYGFERWQEEDFSDDGNRFTCYKVGSRVRVSKLVTGNKAYISARIDGTKLPYEVYSKLPHYKDLDKLNGVHCMLITDDDLTKLFEDCVMYEHEYTAAENGIAMPTVYEIADQCRCWQTKIKNDILTIENILNTNLTKVLTNASSYEWSTIKDYHNKLKKECDKYDPAEYPLKIVDSYISINFCKNEPTDSYYYTCLLEILSKIINKEV